MALGRRQFLGSTAKGLLAAATGAILGPACQAQDKAGRKIVVGGHPWVYAATQPNYDIYPILDRIFADMSYAGLDGIELMHTALRPVDAAEEVLFASAASWLPPFPLSASCSILESL